MKKRIIYLLLLFSLTNCQTETSIINECATTSNQINQQLDDLSEITFLNNLEDAIVCSKNTKNPIFIVFLSIPLSGIRETVENRYKEQLNLILKNQRVRKLVIQNFIPVAILVEDRKRMNEKEVIQNLNMIEDFFGDNNSNFMENFCDRIRSKGNINSNLLMALNRSNATPNFTIVNESGENLGFFGKDEQSIENIIYVALKK